MANSKPPAHLSAEMKEFWREVHRDYELAPEHRGILRVACEQFDRAQAARRRIEEDGMVLDGKRHPLIGVEAKATELYLRAIRDLGLEAPTDRGSGTF